MIHPVKDCIEQVGLSQNVFAVLNEIESDKQIIVEHAHPAIITKRNMLRIGENED